MADKYGLGVCAPIHDALLIESPLSRINQDVALLKDIMRRASRVVLNPRASGAFVLQADAKIVSYPNRYSDRRGVRMWDLVTGMLVQARLGHWEVSLESDGFAWKRRWCRLETDPGPLLFHLL